MLRWMVPASFGSKCSKIYPPLPAASFRNPCVTAARLTPSARATCAFVIPPATIAVHRAQRSGPVSFGPGAWASSPSAAFLR